MPQTHQTYILFSIAQISILVAIEYMELSENILIIKPNSYSIGVTLLLEFYILYIVKIYVNIKVIEVTKLKE